ncbi:MAG: respiratory nitrate reductase subunit gamma [Mycobacterium sp.]
MTLITDAERWWNIAPYLSLTIMAVATWWRYRYDKFGWTTRSSQLYESKLLQVASPMFHFGSFVVIFGHIMGLFVPESWTEALGMSDHLYHLQAMIFGIPAGIATLVGVALLVYRRRSQAAVFRATTVNDKLMYAVLVAALVAGMSCTLMGTTASGEAHDYRQTVSVWFRSIWALDPRGDLMVQAPFYYQVHVMIALVLFALWPFTRLVHAFSAPVGYLFRPYIVYRSRDVAKANQPFGSRPQHRGW